jgi:hypothetical protein
MRWEKNMDNEVARLNREWGTMEKKDDGWHYPSEFSNVVGDEPLGGINFASIQLNYISAYTYPDLNQSVFSIALKAKEAEEGDPIISLGNGSQQSLEFFFTALLNPDDKFWVNLAPWEPDRIIDKDLGKTDIGRIMLEADLQMKKDFCKYSNPCESEIGDVLQKLEDEKKEELIKRCMQKYPGQIKGTNNVWFSRVTRHWIVPDRVDVYENNYEVYILNSSLNIYSEPAYNDSSFEIVDQDPSLISEECLECLNEAVKEYGRYAKEKEDEMILPLVVYDVNHHGNYSDLRQVYVSLALAQWYKEHTGYTIELFSELVDSGNITGFESQDTWSPTGIWEHYVKSYEEGEYHCWMNTTHESGGSTITESRCYQSGGVDFQSIALNKRGDLNPETKEAAIEAINESLVQNNEYCVFFCDFVLPYVDSTKFEFSNLKIRPPKVKVGQQVGIEVDVKNVGSVEDTKKVNLIVNGKKKGRYWEITLAPDESTTLTSTLIQEEAGEYTVTIGGETGSYTVTP